MKISREMVRSTLRLLDLPSEIQTLIKNGKISQDLGWRLLGIKDKSTQIKVANAIQGLDAHDARDIVRYAKNNPMEEIEKHIEKIKKMTSSIKKLNLVILSFDQETYALINKIAVSGNTKPQELISKVVKDWIKEKKGS